MLTSALTWMIQTCLHTGGKLHHSITVHQAGLDGSSAALIHDPQRACHLRAKMTSQVMTP